jgi:hypothetical protein
MSERSFSPNYNFNNNYDNYNNYFESDKLNNFSFNEKNFNPIKDLNNSFDSVDNNSPFGNQLFPDDKLNKFFIPKAIDFGYSEKKIDQVTTKFTDKLLQNNRKSSSKDYPSQEKIEKKAEKEKEVCIEINNGCKIKMGRKKKFDFNKGKHTKNTPDNIIRKIKSNFFSFIHNLLNKSLTNKDIKFLKLSSEINKELKRDFNIKLLNRTIRDIYENTEISTKLRKQSKVNYNINREIISKIYEENIEEQTIKILNLTYFELFQIFRSKIKSIDFALEIKKSQIPLLNTDEFNDIDKFFEKVAFEEEIKNKESQENIDNYMIQIKELCINYENWFLDKKGRNRIKKMIINGIN